MRILSDTVIRERANTTSQRRAAVVETTLQWRCSSLWFEEAVRDHVMDSKANQTLINLSQHLPTAATWSVGEPSVRNSSTDTPSLRPRFILTSVCLLGMNMEYSKTLCAAVKVLYEPR
ncbi:unnamed protein product [Caenorhabditis auriculariae]|uniref:Uncharacterized protein n=1 Tax=Caenorhabditis auriculariae TaxID=2777116 RepID=A0A8S1GWX3_9PELO|nr:unnamed protein product [Caenorhabditis auriculariae]